MELTVRKEDLAKGLQKSQSVVERRTSMPILSNVMLAADDGKLTLTATDLEISFQGSYEARINKPGRVTIPARKFHDIVKELPSEDVYLKEKENNHIHLTGGRASYDLVGMDAEDYPTLPAVEDIPEVKVDVDILGEMIEKTIFSISQEDTRFNLAGLYVQKRRMDDQDILRLVSTDGHRLSLVDRPISGVGNFDIENGIIIPRKGVNELSRMTKEGDGELALGLNGSFATAKKGEGTLILRMQEGSFPDYEVVIPKNPGRSVMVNRQGFSDVIRRVSILATDRFQGVQLNFREGLLELVSQNPELGEARESIEVDYEGESFQVGFNARYFLDLCSAMRSENISLSFIDENNPCLIKGEGDEGFLSVIMPMRL